jgi:hypothetical protein
MVTADSKAPAPNAISQAIERSLGVQMRVVKAPRGKDAALMMPMKKAK